MRRYYLSEIVEFWDSLLYSIYNVLADLKFLIVENKTVFNKNKKIKNKHKGERCFVVVNGPSINNHDLKKLKNETVICVNYMFRSDLINTLCPKYYCWCDSKIFDRPGTEDVFTEIKQKCPNTKLILNRRGVDKLKDFDDAYFTYNMHIPHIFSVSSNLTGNFSNFSSVAFYAINAAIGLGFSEIYLLGLDFTPGVFKHFADLGVKNGWAEGTISKQAVCGDYWLYAKAHYETYALAKHAKKKGIKIINLNPDSCVKAFPFGDYEDLFK